VDGRAIVVESPETHALDPHDPGFRLGDELQRFPQILAMKDLEAGEIDECRLLLEQTLPRGEQPLLALAQRRFGRLAHRRFGRLAHRDLLFHDGVDPVQLAGALRDQHLDLSSAPRDDQEVKVSKRLKNRDPAASTAHACQERCAARYFGVGQKLTPDHRPAPPTQ